MAYTNKYSTKMKNIILNIKNDDLSKISKVYANLLESGNYKNEVNVVKDYLKEVSGLSTLNKQDKNKILTEFRDVTLMDLGILETYNKIVEDYEFVNESYYSERLDVVKQLVSEKPDYLIIERVIDIYKTLTDDEVIQEQVSKLEEQVQMYGEDIRVMSLIDWLSTWEDANKYKKAVSDATESLKTYSLNTNAQTRANAVEALREISYHPVIKEFLNYLIAKNFSDDTYKLNQDYGSKASLATDRMYDGGYLEKWHTGSVKHGLGKIVAESLSDAYKLLNEDKLSERVVVKLLTERLSDVKLNKVDKKFVNGLNKINSTYDLGLFETLKKLRNNEVISRTPQFGKFENLVSENINGGVADKEFINEAYNILSPLSFDHMVEKELNKLNSNYEAVKDTIVLEKFVDYLSENNRLGLYNSLLEDLRNYNENPSDLSKETIYEKYSKTAFDSNVKQFLNYLRTQINNTNRIVNTNPKEFSVNKVFGIYEKIGEVEHFIIDGSYLTKDNSGLKVATEKSMDSRLKEVYENFVNLGLNYKENGIEGYVGKHKVSVELNEENKSIDMKINGGLFDKTNADLFQYVHSNTGDFPGLKKVISLHENFDVFTEFDNIANQIVYTPNPKVRVNILNVDGVYNINFINEGLKINKWSKTRSYETLKSKLEEFMGFDISESFQSNQVIDKTGIDKLKETANSKYNEILETEKQMEKLHTKINSIEDKMIQAEGWSVYETFQDNLNSLKMEYRQLVNKMEK
jgi:hypothetical protein